MKQWSMQDAKAQLSRVIDLARSEGPQTITRHGRPVAVVAAIAEFKQLRAPTETPLEFFSNFKGLGRRLTRSKNLPRKLPA